MENDILISILSMVISVLVSSIVSIIVVLINNRNNDKNKMRERGYELTKETITELKQILNKLENLDELNTSKNADFNEQVTDSIVIMYGRAFKIMKCLDQIKFNLIPFFEENYYNDLYIRLEDLKNKWQILYASAIASKNPNLKPQMEEMVRRFNCELVPFDLHADKMKEYIDKVYELFYKIKIDIEKKLKTYISF